MGGSIIPKCPSPSTTNKVLMPVFNECRDHRKVPFLTQTHQPKPINFEKLYNYQTVILRNEFCMVKKIQI